jgi:hypothetical protein
LVATWAILLGISVALFLTAKIDGAQLMVLAGVSSVVVVWLAVIFLQNVFPPPANELKSPIWDEITRVLDLPMPAIVAVARGQYYLAAVREIVCYLAFTTGFLVGGDRKLARLLLLVIAFSGAILTIFSTVSFLFGPHAPIGSRKASLQNCLDGHVYQSKHCSRLFRSDWHSLGCAAV